MLRIILPILLLFISCKEEGKLRVAIQDSPNECLKEALSKDSDIKLVNTENVDILVSLDSNLIWVSIDSSLNFKNAKNGNELKYFRQKTIFGVELVPAILGYEISACDFVKRHAKDLAKLSVAEWNLDSSANGEMYISSDGFYSRQAWIAMLYVLQKDTIIYRSRGYVYPKSYEDMDTVLKPLDIMCPDDNDIGLEDIQLIKTLFVTDIYGVPFDILAKITNRARKTGCSEIIYNYFEDHSDVYNAKRMLNSLFYSYELSDWLESEIYSHYYNSGVADEEKDFFIFDFETKSAEPIQIVVKIKKYKKPKEKHKKFRDGEDLGEIIFSFVKENDELKISEAKMNGTSIKEPLRLYLIKKEHDPRFQQWLNS